MSIPSTDPSCLEQTCRILGEHALGTNEEIHKLKTHGSSPLRGPRPWDPIEFLAALRVRDPDARPVEIEKIGRALGQAAGHALVLLPFASRLPTPSGFFETNQELLEDCKRLLTPILYVEESEVIGIGSISPIALGLASQRIVQSLSERTGTRPVVTKVLLHHEGWLTLCQKQFEL